jgi:2-keto-4-pentenoate hydratase/2-oxohepta-3-ene-1,7-dioic acid hydratase in catechol pathway
MQLASYITRGRSGFGAVVGNGVVDIRLRFAPRFASLLDVLREGALAEVKAGLAGVRPDYALTEVELLRPILRPDKIICVGASLGDNAGDKRPDAGRFPNLFLRVPGSFVGHGQPILRPREWREIDCEGEIALVIGKPGRRVPPEQALDILAGYTLCHAGAVRGFLPRGWHTITPTKNFDSSGSLGPWIVTGDEIDMSRPLRLISRINGEVWRDHTTTALPFSFAELISFVSIFIALEPGDVILTGTAAATAERPDPPRSLKPGDVIETSVAEIGVLRNTVIDEP